MIPELKQFPIQDFQQDLLYWFERNMRNLPWRKDRDPYKVWVSEIMLQQTRVDTVIPYFEHFMNQFPTLESLAAAPEDEVLKCWEGLGYYSRARNLQTAVREVKEKYGGKVPDEPEEISKLKGVGPYTAGAILSIAYGKREPAVDGNVMRVFSRIFAIKDDISKVKTRKKFETIIRELIPDGSASFFNQGVMELGALICTPTSPQCTICPVREYCQAKAEGIEHELPVKAKKKKPRTVHLVVGVLLKGDRVLIRQRPKDGLLAKLFEFPNVTVDEGGRNGSRSSKEKDKDETISRYIYHTYQWKCLTKEQYESVQHTFTHLVWHLDVYELAFASASSSIDEGHTSHENDSLPEGHYWVKLNDLDSYAFPVSHQKIKKDLLRRKRLDPST